MLSEKVKLSSIKVNKKNPRKIDKMQFDSLVKSILVFPKMLNDLRPIVVDENMTILGGNMRYRALIAISTMTADDCRSRMSLAKNFNKKTSAEKAEIENYWNEWRQNPIVDVVKADNLDDEAKKEFIIKDNVSFGEWDTEVLNLDFDVQDLSDWGLEQGSLPGDDLTEEEKKSQIYEPLNKDFFLFPQSILDTRRGDCIARRVQWKNIGLTSGNGRKEELTFSPTAIPPKYLSLANKYAKEQGISTTDAARELISKGIIKTVTTSIFDPVVAETCYRWFNIKNGTILDPFAGGSVRGIVASALQMPYFGNDLREEQIEANRQNLQSICTNENTSTLLMPEYYPQWTTGDSVNIKEIVEGATPKFPENGADMIFSCPPYADLEVYSDDERDLSNMDYDKFLSTYTQIIKNSCELLKNNRFAVFVVGDVRDKKGYYRDFASDTIRAFKSCGLHYYGQLIVVKSLGSASIRARAQFSTRKMPKTHQNIIVSFKGEKPPKKEDFEAVSVKDCIKYFNDNRSPIDTAEYVEVFYKGDNPAELKEYYPIESVCEVEL